MLRQAVSSSRARRACCARCACALPRERAAPPIDCMHPQRLRFPSPTKSPGCTCSRRQVTTTEGDGHEKGQKRSLKEGRAVCRAVAPQQQPRRRAHRGGARAAAVASNSKQRIRPRAVCACAQSGCSGVALRPKRLLGRYYRRPRPRPLPRPRPRAAPAARGARVGRCFGLSMSTSSVSRLRLSGRM